MPSINYQPLYLILVSFLTPSLAFSGGFSIPEQNVSGMGNAYAGAVAVAEDASTVYYNPAGITKIQGKQLVLSGTLLSIRNSLKNESSLPAVQNLAPLTFQALGNNSDSRENPVIGNAYFSQAISSNLHWGIGIGSEFGLMANYDRGWFGRYIVSKSEMQTVTFNPSIAVALSDTLSAGFGINYMTANAKLSNASNFGVFGDGTTKISVKDNSWGGNVGILWSPRQGTQIGIAYRSSYRLKMKGNISTTFPGTVDQQALLPPVQQIALAAANSQVDVDLKLPDTASIGFVHSLDDRMQILADLTWTHWSVFKSLQVINSNVGVPLTTIPQNWKDALRLAVGMNIGLSPVWKLKLGAGYDQSPVPNAYRSPIVPDTDKFVVAIGMQHIISKNIAVDAGYIHAFAKKSKINDSPRDALGNRTPGAGVVIAEGSQNVDVVGVQLRYSF